MKRTGGGGGCREPESLGLTVREPTSTVCTSRVLAPFCDLMQVGSTYMPQVLP